MGRIKDERKGVRQKYREKERQSETGRQTEVWSTDKVRKVVCTIREA